MLHTHHSAAGRLQYQVVARLDGAQLEQQHVRHDVVGGQGRGVHEVQAVRYGEHVLGGHGHELGPRAPFGQRHDAIADLNENKREKKKNIIITDI